MIQDNNIAPHEGCCLSCNRRRIMKTKNERNNAYNLLCPSYLEMEQSTLRN
jgi:hypothetical protein